MAEKRSGSRSFGEKKQHVSGWSNSKAVIVKFLVIIIVNGK